MSMESLDASKELQPLEESKLCLEGVAHQLIPSQPAEESPVVHVTQDPDAWEKLLEKRRPAGLGTISRMVSGFERPRGRVEHGKGG